MNNISKKETKFLAENSNISNLSKQIILQEDENKRTKTIKLISIH